MASDDWYRCSTWDEDARALFRQKLARARSHRNFYLRMKARAIASQHPEDALALYQEYLDAVDHDGDPATVHYAMAMIHWNEGREDKLFEYLDMAMGDTGMGLGASGVMENAFVSAILGKTDRYERALALFEPWDEAAQSQLGRDFVRTFAGAFGSAIIFDHLGRSDEAREAALTALEWTETTTGPIPGHPNIGAMPAISEDWKARMIGIAQR